MIQYLYMKRFVTFFYCTLLSLPFIVLLYILLHPPQCPENFSQEQVDASRCIIGANIGGTPLFLIGAVTIWLLARWIIIKIQQRKKHIRP